MKSHAESNPSSDASNGEVVAPSTADGSPLVPRDSNAQVVTSQKSHSLDAIRRHPQHKQPKSHFPTRSFSSAKAAVPGHESNSQEKVLFPRDDIDGTPQRPRLSSRSLSGLARKSWVAVSRSSSISPSRRGVENTQRYTSDRSSFSRSSSYPNLETLQERDLGSVTQRADENRKQSRRPLSSLVRRPTPSSEAPLVPSIPRSFSSDRLLSAAQHGSTEDPPTIPTAVTYNRLQAVGPESSKKKDELWSSFRDLEGEYQKFVTRTSISKPAFIRSTLLPFLKNFASHPSNSNLRPEHLDRRTNTLNKWWTGLLEMLNGRNGESVSGSDRPMILEAVTAIMTRPEWNAPYPSASFGSETASRLFVKSQSTTSLQSTSSDFLVDSVLHNVKNLFIQNLLAQMSYVVDKMSSRNVPASVVAFCGKATAYAFFYCDGIAEILVRLWAIPTEAMRRILIQKNLQRDTDLRVSADRVSNLFPSCLKNLTFSSVRSMSRSLRKRPQVPFATSYIPWHGPWLSRWAGRDTDLFYIFTKFYYHLVSIFLPATSTRQERICVPGFVLVQAQLFTVLESVIQRSCNQPLFDSSNATPPTSFEDMLEEADASAAILPLPPSHTNRSIAENRLIMLMRDCLSGTTNVYAYAREIFAESIEALLRAIASSISIYDHNACFALCDFMEEAITILVRYDHTSVSSSPAIDWSFWFKVCKRMMESQNTMTDIRLHAFLYSLWGTLVADKDRKHQVCVEWLLDEDTFEKQFNHWCPMVRAYYMRLLCWKIGRLDGSASEIDIRIQETLSLRLKHVWCHFLYAQDQARNSGQKPPSTAPCSPAPGRRLIILRNDSQPSPIGMFMKFDSVLPPATSSQATAYQRHGSLNLTTPTTSPSPNSRLSTSSKRRWTSLKSFLPFVGSSFFDDQSRIEPSALESETSTMKIGGKTQINSLEAQITPSKLTQGKNAFRMYSFKFSLEWVDKGHTLFGQEMSLSPPKVPIPAQKGSQQPILEELQGSPSKPEGIAATSIRYSGRALAEWTLIVTEFQKFMERRMMDGVPESHLVETPTLGIDHFRGSR